MNGSIGTLWEMDQDELNWMREDLPRLAGRTGGKILLHCVGFSRYLHNLYAADVAQRLDFRQVLCTWHFPTEICAVDLKRCAVQLYAECNVSPFARSWEVTPSTPPLADLIREEVARQLGEHLKISWLNSFTDSSAAAA